MGRRHRTLLTLLACVNHGAVAMGRTGELEVGQGRITHLFPIHMSAVQLTSDKPGIALEPPEFDEELKSIALAKFSEYSKTILPKELELDAPFAEEFRSSDHSRKNLAFRRWQKRVYAKQTGTPVNALTARGDNIPELPGISYSWPELYASKAFGKLKVRITELAKLYMKRSGYTTIPNDFDIFVWVEVFNKGDAMRPIANTDHGYLAGKYFAASPGKSPMKFNFEDPRGINPPFGKTNTHGIQKGQLVLLPTWVSSFFTPNVAEKPVVVYAFQVYPKSENSTKRRSWTEDQTTNMKVSSVVKVPQPKR